MLTAPASPFRQASVHDLTQLRPAERAALADYLARLRERYADRILHVILYGSRARGEGDAESDLDVLVVVEDGDWRFKEEISLEAFEPSLENNVDLAAQVWSAAEYEQHAQNRFLFFRNLESDGRSLWNATRNKSMLVTG